MADLGVDPANPAWADSALLGVVLAGGQSSRMGQDKANLLHDPEPTATAAEVAGEQATGAAITYLQHAIGRLKPLVPIVAISGRGVVQDADVRVIAIPDAAPHQGPVAGIQRSLEQAKQFGLEGILVTPVDMPNLDTGHLGWLIQAWRQSMRRGPIVTATFDGIRTEPLVAIYPVTCQQAIEKLAGSMDRSLSRWLRTETTVLVPLPRSAGKNVNRPEDYHYPQNSA